MYDLETDRGETKDLAEQHPDIVNQLAELYAAWAERTGVVDYDKIKPASAGPLPGDAGIKK